MACRSVATLGTVLVFPRERHNSLGRLTRCNKQELIDLVRATAETIPDPEPACDNFRDFQNREHNREGILF